MIGRLFPSSADNRFAGPRAAVWLLGLLLVVKGLMGANTIIAGRYVAQGADGIPLDTYGASAAGAVLALFALWGLGQLMLVLHGAIVIVRYRSLVPLVYSILIIEHLGRKLLLLYIPIPRTGGGGSNIGAAINLGLLLLLVAGFLLSLRARSTGGQDR